MTHLGEYMLKGGTNPLCDVWKGKKGKEESSSERCVERSKENKAVKNVKGNLLSIAS